MVRYIRADDALAELNRLMREHDDDLIKHGVISESERTAIPKFMWEAVVAKTTSDVAEVRHSGWRKMSHNLGYECKDCGWESGVPYDYCPNCGARMDGGA